MSGIDVLNAPSDTESLAQPLLDDAWQFISQGKLAVLVWDRQLRLLHASAAASELLGRTVEQLGGHFLNELLPVSEHFRLSGQLLNLRPGMPPLALEGWILNSRLQEMRIQWLIWQLDDSRQIGLMYDQRELSALRDEVQMRRELYSALVTQARDAIVLINPHTASIIEFNPAAADMLGYSPAEFGRLQLVELGRLEDINTWLGYAREATNGECVIRDTLLSTKQGTRINVRISSRPVLIQGEVMLATLWTDITPSHHARQEIAALTQHMNQVLRDAQIGAWDYDIPSGIIHVNEQFHSHFSHVFDSLDTHIDEWRKIRHPVDEGNADAALLAHLEGKTPEFEGKWRLMQEDGSWHWYISRGKVIEWADDGAPLRMTGTIIDLSAQQDSLGELIRSETKSRAMLDALSAAIAILNQDGQVITTNAAWERFENRFGVPPSECLRLRPPAGTGSGFQFDELYEAYQAGLHTVLRSELDYFEIEIPSPCGEELQWFLCRMQRVHELNGHVLLAHEDITQQKLIHQAISDTRSRYEELLHNVDGIVWEADPGTHNTTFVSSQCERMLGYPPHSWMQPGFWISCVHPADRAMVMHTAMEKVAVEEDYELEYRFQTRDGRWVWLHDRASVRRNDAGKLQLSGLVIDITARKQAEEQLRLAASVFQYAHEGILITDADNRVIDMNSAFLSMTGYERSELLGQKPAVLRSGRHHRDFYVTMWERIHSQGHWRGEIWNRRKSGELCVDLLTISAVLNTEQQISHYVGVYADITQLKQQEQKLELLAHYDALTGLPNRVLLADRLEQALALARRSGLLLAVCYLDLDDFKPINDRYGHEVGDDLLVEISRRLIDNVRGGDTVARLGGDEFVLLLGNHTSTEECEQALKRILHVVSVPYLYEGDVLRVSASLGVTLYPQDGADAEGLLRHADQAMYSAKQSGANRYHFFDAQQDQQMRSQRQLLDRIARAQADNELQLYYQPKVDMRSGRVIGAEALLRWQHPERGMVMPGEFLPVLESSVLVSDVGYWIIGTVLAQMHSWQSQHDLRIPISVNVSPRQLANADFPLLLAKALARHEHIDPALLEIEIVESAALEDIGRAIRILNICRGMGVRFALDDFGTGYSSLTYFKRLPAEVLKIDQSFVRNMLTDPNDEAIVRAVISLAEAFERKVIAEGVETAQHGELLASLGCHHVQGYGIAKPMPAAAFPQWVRDYEANPRWLD
ncbi:EAL domain-containing protein [Chitinilyticum piscinae]|uniref:EAL domain-containing protein n=1 Tax=Chitinilyticum piscinae TaxID=2866724 RepID=A0A8J7FJG0_9NEIS|nr:EAL domain-containing protein [Chitinilyticum piscinae]MBE9607949.1 EAL domain-containing protein [Chitinilyticum piscinae]